MSERSPKVAAARELAERFGADQVVVVMVSRRSSTLEYASYGRTRLLCAEARQLGDRLYEAAFRFFCRPLFPVGGGADGD